jgi:hypothetical protein
VTTLHLQQASLTWRDSDREARTDIRAALARNAHLIGWTEVYADVDILTEECRRAGYHRPVWGPTKSGKTETAIAVREDLQLLDHGSILVNPADSGTPPHGGHSARYATWVQAECEDEEVFLAEAHWVTRRGEGRTAKRRRMSRTLADLATEHGQGRSLAFIAGDTNDPDQPNNDGSAVYEPLERAGLVTCWDEAGRYPPTHIGKGSDPTIDIIASLEADARVRFVRAETHPGSGQHRFVSAFYEIATRGQGPVKHACPTCGLIHRPPKKETP